MRDLTIVLPYYCNAGMLRRHQDEWAAYPNDIRAHLHVIVVDDGSPTSPAIDAWAPPSGLGSARLYRTGVDVRWNWIFCRNLGASEAATDWLLLTDIDHLVPTDTWRGLMTDHLDETEAFQFRRLDAPDLTPTIDRHGRPKPHPNSWCLTKALYDRVGGYDERLSGFYGTDAEFRERVYHEASSVVLRDEALIRYPREVIPDASTTTYGRKEEQDRENLRVIREARKALGYWRPLRLTFPWERLA